MWEIWEGDEFLFATDDTDEANELKEAGLRVIFTAQ